MAHSSTSVYTANAHELAPHRVRPDRCTPLILSGHSPHKAGYALAPDAGESLWDQCGRQRHILLAYSPTFDRTPDTQEKARAGSVRHIAPLGPFRPQSSSLVENPTHERRRYTAHPVLIAAQSTQPTADHCRYN